MALASIFFLQIVFVMTPVVAVAASASSDASIMRTQETGAPIRGDSQIGPTRFVLEMLPGETKTVHMELLSREGTHRQYAISVEDFSITNDGTDTIQFFENDNGPFPAKSWIQPAASSLTLKHGERARIPVTISVPHDAKAGDHYAVVVVQNQRSTDENIGTGLLSRVGAIFLITVKGDLRRDGELQQFSRMQHVYWSSSAQLSMRYRNTGTVHLVPAGSIVIKNMFGIAIDEIAVQDWYVLRDSLRVRDVTWQPTFALGRYTATLTLESSGQKSAEVITVSFWMLPILPLLFAFMTIISVWYIAQAIRSRS